MNIDAIKSVYFVGAGGIGMSALVRYFLSLGKVVAGYDRTASELTERLNAEGASIHYEDSVALIPEACKDKAHTLVVYTPAVPRSHSELTWFDEQGFEIQKRAQVLGTITRSRRGLCVAGTHGKTTTSSMAAHLVYGSHVGATAFLGGISQNYGTNLLLTDKSDYVVIEADEYDRSFHQLSPYMTVITSTDPDHLDIYGTPEAYWESFEIYTSLIQPGGALIIHEGLEITPRVLAVCQINVRDDIHDTAVGLLRQAFILTAVACFHMEDGNMQALGGDRRQAGVGVPQNEERVRLDRVHQLIGAVDDVANGSAQVVPYCVHVHFGIGELQIVKEHAVQGIIVVLPRVGEDTVKIAAAFMDHGGQPNDLRARAHDDQQLQLAVFLPLDVGIV